VLLPFRFDIMWLLLDEHDEANDKRLAAHIIAVHQGRVGAPAAAEAAAAGNQAGSSRQQQQRRQQEGASTSGVSSGDA
jgi:DNA replicative helicase MCM subunit Mcm2 (Cdc46/Mcm family)